MKEDEQEEERLISIYNAEINAWKQLEEEEQQAEEEGSDNSEQEENQLLFDKILSRRLETENHTVRSRLFRILQQQQKEESVSNDTSESTDESLSHFCRAVQPLLSGFQFTAVHHHHHHSSSVDRYTLEGHFTRDSAVLAAVHFATRGTVIESMQCKVATPSALSWLDSDRGCNLTGWIARVVSYLNYSRCQQECLQRLQSTHAGVVHVDEDTDKEGPQSAQIFLFSQRQCSSSSPLQQQQQQKPLMVLQWGWTNGEEWLRCLRSSRRNDSTGLDALLRICKGNCLQTLELLVSRLTANKKTCQKTHHHDGAEDEDNSDRGDESSSDDVSNSSTAIACSERKRAANASSIQATGSRPQPAKKKKRKAPNTQGASSGRKLKHKSLDIQKRPR